MSVYNFAPQYAPQFYAPQPQYAPQQWAAPAAPVQWAQPQAFPNYFPQTWAQPPAATAAPQAFSNWNFPAYNWGVPAQPVQVPATAAPTAPPATAAPAFNWGTQPAFNWGMPVQQQPMGNYLNIYGISQNLGYNPNYYGTPGRIRLPGTATVTSAFGNLGTLTSSGFKLNANGQALAQESAFAGTFNALSMRGSTVGGLEQLTSGTLGRLTPAQQAAAAAAAAAADASN